MLLRIMIISAGYPSITNKHSFGFVHARSKIYKKYGHNVYVVVPTIRSQMYDDIVSYVYEGIRVLRVSYSCIAEAIKCIDPDVIAYHFPDPLVLREVISAKKPLVIWIHGADILIKMFHSYFIPFFVSDVLRGVASIPYDFLRNISLRKILLLRKDIQFIFPSTWMKNMFQKYLLFPRTLRKNMHVIPNPIDTDMFRPIIDCSDKDRSFAISVRALHYKYGVDIAVKAFAKLKYVKLIIVGNGPLRDYLKKLARQLQSNIEFIHEGIPHNSLPEYYNKVGMFVAPSRTEAQGVAMCEALATGTPVIATRVGGIPEFVISGYNGILVPKNDPVALRQAIIKMLKYSPEKYCYLSRNAREYALKKLSHRVIIPRELKVMSRSIEIFGGSRP